MGVMQEFREFAVKGNAIDLAIGVLMWVLARAVPSAQLWPVEPLSIATLAGLGVAFAGGLVALAGALEFNRARTTGSEPGSAGAGITMQRHSL